jgi:hypothetical protein
VFPCIIVWTGAQTGYVSVGSLGESAKINNYTIKYHHSARYELSLPSFGHHQYSRAILSDDPVKYSTHPVGRSNQHIAIGH